MNIKDFFGKVVLSRPYTLSSIIALGIVSYLLANQQIKNTESFVFVIIVSSSFWLFSTYLAEYFHNKTNKNRPFVNFVTPLFFLLALILFTYQNLISLIMVIILIISIWAYSLKVKNTVISPYSFIFRGIVELSVALFFLSYQFNSIFTNTSFLISIYLITTSRNLIGDLRDKDEDNFTFTKKHGENITLAVSLFCLAGAALLNFSAVSFPLFLTIISLFTIKNSYIQHNVFVLSTFFFFINYAFILQKMDVLISNLIFIGVIMMYSYHFVPREANIKLGGNFYGTIKKT